MSSNPTEGPFVEGLTKIYVENENDIQFVIESARSNRIGTTSSGSSIDPDTDEETDQSHLIMTLTLERTIVTRSQSSTTRRRTVSNRLCVYDLAVTNSSVGTPSDKGIKNTKAYVLCVHLQHTHAREHTRARRLHKHMHVQLNRGVKLRLDGRGLRRHKNQELNPKKPR